MRTVQRLGRISFAALTLSFVPLWAAEPAPGVPNFHQVNAQLYRGGQPTNTGWNSLAKLGVKTVIDLRREAENGDHSPNREQRAVEAAGMHYLNVPMNGIVAPSDEQIAKVLAVLDSGQAVFVHCRQGKDRTGTVIACYRIAHDHWTNEKAYREAQSYGLHWVEFGMKRYIQAFRASGALPRVEAGLQPQTTSE